MSNLNECIKRLKNFNQYPGIAEILLDLGKFNNGSFFKKAFKHEDILSLRTRLFGILLNIDSDPVASPDLGDTVYDMLLILVKLKSINEKDPITLDFIKNSNTLFVSSGHKFDINALVNFHNTRKLRPEDVDKSDCKYKWLINPITNQKFSRRDFLQIQMVALKHHLIIDCKEINNSPIVHARRNSSNINDNNLVVNARAEFYLDSIIENMENMNGLLRYFNNMTRNVINNLEIINLRIIIFFQGFLCLAFSMIWLSIFNDSMLDKADDYTKCVTLGLCGGGVTTGTALIFHSLFSPRQDLQFAKKAINYIGRSIQGDKWHDINPNLS